MRAVSKSGKTYTIACTECNGTGESSVFLPSIGGVGGVVAVPELCTTCMGAGQIDAEIDYATTPVRLIVQMRDDRFHETTVAARDARSLLTHWITNANAKSVRWVIAYDATRFISGLVTN